MGKFARDVQKSLLKSPLRRDFDLKSWTDAILSAEDTSDRLLCMAGYVFDNKLKKLWEQISKIPFAKYSGEKLRRELVAIANRDFSTLRGKMKRTAEALPNNQEYSVDAMLSIKVDGALNGIAYNIDDLAASSVDGLHMPLMRSYTECRGFHESADLNDIHQLVILGQLQSLIAGLWEDFVWLGDRFTVKEQEIIAHPANIEAARARAAAFSRFVTRQSETMHHAFNLWLKLPEDYRAHINSSRRVVRVTGTGSSMTMKAFPAPVDPQMPIQSFVLRFTASEIYFKEIFECELPKLPGVTLNILLSAWEVLFSLGESLAASMPTESGIETNKDLRQFSPVITQIKLCKLLTDSLEIEYRLAKSIVVFLSFSGQPTDELWAQPLVVIEHGRVVPMMTCLLSGNTLRLVERWMKLGGLRLQDRGKAFESHVRDQISQALQSKRLLSEGGVCPHAYKFKRGSNDPGDIDLLIWFGSTILIGEVKCNLFPTKAVEHFNYFGDLERGARQILRKQDALRTDLARFWKDIAKRAQPQETMIVPFVLSNLGLGVGMKFDSVPIVDLLIIEKFLGEGFMPLFVTLDPERGFSECESQITFYKTSDEAEKVVSEYLNNPPQLRHFRDAVKPVINRVPCISDSDCSWNILDYEVHFESEDVEKLRSALKLEKQTADFNNE